MLNFTAFPPSPRLQSVVQSYVLCEANLPVDKVSEFLLIPVLSEMLHFNLNHVTQHVNMKGKVIEIKNGFICGQLSHSFKTQFVGNVKFLGVHLHVSTLHHLFNISLREHVNDAIPLENIVGNQMAMEMYREVCTLDSIDKVISRLEEFLIPLAEKIKPGNHNIVFNALAHIKNSQGRTTVKELAAINRISDRTLQKLFLAQVGLTPKEYCRIFRFNEVIQMMNTNTFSWKYVVDTLGYFDQAHFLNDFKSITGVTPAEYFIGHPQVNKFFTELIADAHLD